MTAIVFVSITVIGGMWGVGLAHRWFDPISGVEIRLVEAWDQ